MARATETEESRKAPVVRQAHAKALEHIENFNINDIKPIDPLAEINRQINENHNNLLRGLKIKQ
ncbi:hypothetical protein VK70_15450 [Paenibacillus durus ATCC 35681]|uniref:Uncharacterized protein n=1 Tax=Paenibacillus durus ATCC 35681 TaxID=1333534 RepID=A0A0F7FBX7_PAEDU|nr:hypothetical protein VK70_15450 [Paenibacillus durus ATCC 35681]